MATTCNVRENAIDYLKNKKVINDYMTIVSPLFYLENDKLTNYAKQKYGLKTEGSLFKSRRIVKQDIIRGGNAIPVDDVYKVDVNEELFKELQEQYDIVEQRKEKLQTKKELIKPGVEELFDSNPELANQVYEALGFKQTVIQDDKSYYRGQIEEPTVDKNGNLVLYGREDELYKRAGLKSKGISMTDDLQTAIEYGNGQLEVAKNLKSEENIGIDLERELDKLDENGYYLIQIPKSISNEIVKEAGEVKVIGDRLVIPKGQYKIEQVVDGVEQITSQQKQQALQLYSQYLDSVFPDSKVKDIVYHGADEKISFFDFTKKKNKNEKGLFFFGKKRSAQLWRDASFEEDNTSKGDLIQAIINLKNPRIEDFENKSAWDMQHYVSADNSKLTEKGKSLMNSTFNKVDNNKAVIYANYLTDAETTLKKILNRIAVLSILENLDSDMRAIEQSKAKLIVESIEKDDNILKRAEKEIKNVTEQIGVYEFHLEVFDLAFTNSIPDLEGNILSAEEWEKITDPMRNEIPILESYRKKLEKAYNSFKKELGSTNAKRNSEIEELIENYKNDRVSDEKVLAPIVAYKNQLKDLIKESKDFFLGEISNSGKVTNRNIFDVFTPEYINSFIEESRYSLTVKFLKDANNKQSIKDKTKNLVRELERRLGILKNKKNNHYLMTILNLKQYNEKVKDIPTNLKENQDGLIATNVVEMWTGIDTQYAVFEPEQIHILKSDKDIEGFKEFVSGVEDKATESGLSLSSDEAAAYNSLVSNGTIPIKCE